MGFLGFLKKDVPPDPNVEWVKQLRIVSTGPGSGRLVTPGGEIVHGDDPRVRRGGLLAVSVAGWNYHEKAVKKAECSSGTPAALLREPKNEYDRNAVQILARSGLKGLGLAKVGYVPADQAKRLAPRLDRGESIKAVFLRGPGPGELPTYGISVLIGHKDIVGAIEGP